MSQLNDCIHEALKALGFEGQINDQLLALYRAEGATLGQINDAELEWLQLKGATAGQLNDAWFEYLTGLGYEGALNDMQREFWCLGGPAPAPNVLLNSSWLGMSGSVGGADFVEPNDWTTGFWPPDEAIAVAETGYNALALQAVANRGFLTITVPSTELIGKQVNISCFVDAFTSAINQRIVHISSGATEVQRCPFVTGVGRYGGIYEVTSNAVTVRVGAGTTANDDMDFTVSRPQLTEGPGLRPYQPT